MNDELEQRVIAVVAKQKNLDPSTIALDSTFAQLGIDSLDAADLLFSFEDGFGLLIPDSTARSMVTVGAVVEALRPLLAAKQAGPDTANSGSETTPGTPSAGGPVRKAGSR